MECTDMDNRSGSGFIQQACDDFQNITALSGINLFEIPKNAFHFVKARVVVCSKSSNITQI